jgi:hypothetical protein
LLFAVPVQDNNSLVFLLAELYGTYNAITVAAIQATISLQYKTQYNYV